MVEKLNVLKSVSAETCCGCGACINICPKDALSYSHDKYGFIRPIINEDNCINCGKCLNVCPALVIDKRKTIKTFAALSKESIVVKNSSSGGIFYEIASFIIQNKGVVYGSIMDESFQVKHCRAESIEELKPLMRSKYIQSDLHFSFQNIEKDLKAGLQVLFVGTPCQVSAVRNYTSKIRHEGKLLTVDVVCHGVPSQSMFNGFINQLSEKEGEIEKFTFRTKKAVRNGMNWYFSYKRKGDNKEVIRNWPSASYPYYYMMSYLNRDSCYQCKYTARDRVGDFTLCDFWHWDEYDLSFKIGSSVSGVFINSEEALLLFQQIDKKLLYQETNSDYIINNNGCLHHPVEKPEDRELILEMYSGGGYSKVDAFFHDKYRKQIKKYKLRMLIPQSLLNFVVYIYDKLKK